ncbi:MAG: hypothetical protein NVV74_00970 [Magnetospirillum sp.]|nr:hypothetical protein [Magnetospirillum sp.]
MNTVPTCSARSTAARGDLVQALGVPADLRRQGFGALGGAGGGLVDGGHLLLHDLAELAHLGGGVLGHQRHFLGLQAQQVLHLARPRRGRIGGLGQPVHFAAQGVQGRAGLAVDAADQRGHGVHLLGHDLAHRLGLGQGLARSLGQFARLGAQRVGHRLDAGFGPLRRIGQARQLLRQLFAHRPHGAAAVEPGHHQPQEGGGHQCGAGDATQFLRLQHHDVFPADAGGDVGGAEAEPADGEGERAEIDGGGQAGFGLGRHRGRQFGHQARRHGRRLDRLRGFRLAGRFQHQLVGLAAHNRRVTHGQPRLLAHACAIAWAATLETSAKATHAPLMPCPQNSGSNQASTARPPPKNRRKSRAAPQQVPETGVKIDARSLHLC